MLWGFLKALKLRSSFALFGAFALIASLSSPAMAKDVSSDVRESCEAVTKFPSSELSPLLKKEIAQCKLEFEGFHCAGIAKRYPEVKAHLRKCDASSICHGDINPASAFYSYGKGYAKTTVDGLKALGDLAWQKGVKDMQSTAEITAKCDALPQCKRAVANDVPWRKSLTDEELKNYSSFQLEAEAMAASGLQKLSGFVAGARDCVLNPPSATQIADTSEQVKKAAIAKWDAFTDWEDEQLVLTTLRYHCADAEGQAEIVGSTTAALNPLTITSAAGAAGKATSYLSATAELAHEPAEIERARKATDEARRASGDLSSATNADRRGAETSAGRPREKVRDAPRIPVRDEFIASNLHKTFATPEQNARFVELAEAAGAGNKTVFIDVENSAMKALNDKTRDKNLVTSLTNRHKQIFLEQIDTLQKANPGLELVPYSDFKSIRIAAHGKIPADLEAQLQKLWAEANGKFTDELLSRSLVRKSDQPQNWFRGGMGDSADQANLMARAAREQAQGENRIVSFASSPDVRERIGQNLKQVDQQRIQMVTSLKSTPLLSATASGETLTREAFDLVRKYPTAQDLQTAVQKRFGLKDFSAGQAEQMLSYAKGVDQFSPGIHVIKREIVNLDEAEKGGFSVDFLGLGSANQRATAEALMRARGVDETLKETRIGEKKVTADFKSYVDRFKEISGGFARCSGDDCVGIATTALKPSDKQMLLNRLVNDDKTRKIRVAFVAEGVSLKEDRTMLGTHGESIEKFLRKKLEGKVPANKLDASIFAIDMQSQKANTGAVKLMVASGSNVKWTEGEWRRLQDALRQAVDSHNADLAKDGIASRYSAVRTTCADSLSRELCAPPLEAHP